jgi:AraC-like DNA-binding protein
MDTDDMILYFSDMKSLPEIRVTPNSAGITACARDWSWDIRRNPPDDYDLWTVIQGEGVLSEGGREYPLGPGDCFLLKPGGKYVGSHTPDNPLTVIHIHFDFAVTDVAESFLYYRKLSSLGFVRELVSRSVLSFHEGEAGQSAFWLAAALQEIRQQDLRSESVLQLEGRAEEIEQICARIRNAPGSNHRLPELAGSVNLSTDHFTRLFKRMKGLTPRDFILRTRIETAQSLLQVSSYTVTRIAEILGYSDVYFFSKQFTAKVGVTPTVYRRQAVA